ncbi:hypothetical protein TSUD_272280 [Trifolium subterraneum]|uniref:RRM domain-containing protein n=1 Tax=Trifolium subterraneum TaxID=3900 RepID=A0A2Z6P0I4_TRISU|nr:hypothetical protein TSUD_272280 [Trifolium subterraneum]
MREKGERREGGASKDGGLGGYLHRLDMETTSFFFINFPEDVKMLDLWPKFGRYGRVAEVYIPNKLDKQGRRFGFVRFREVRDVEELLSRISDIWIGTYKLRVNRTRFRRDEARKDQQQPQKKPGRVEDTLVFHETQQGRSFKDALSSPRADKGSKVCPVVVEEERKQVMWEVEVEEDKVALLKSAYVGFLSEAVEVQLLQQYFVMDGYHNVKLTILGHMKVLLSSPHVDEVSDIVRSVGWWSKWFDHFVPWSPASVSHHREVWLSCYGVPLFVWGVSLFKSIAFKFGTFIDIDASTKEMLRGDVARVKVATTTEERIDSSMVILVLGQKFTIRVMEDFGGWYGGGSRCQAGGSVEGSDGDPSQSCQVLVALEKQAAGKGGNMSPRRKLCQDVDVSGCSPNFLGNSCDSAKALVNEDVLGTLNYAEESRGRWVESAGSGENRVQETNNSLSKAMCDVNSQYVSCGEAHVAMEGSGMDQVAGGQDGVARGLMVGSGVGQVVGGLDGAVHEDWACDLGPPFVGGGVNDGPAVLRTKGGDLLIHGPTLSNPFIDESGGVGRPIGAKASKKHTLPKSKLMLPPGKCSTFFGNIQGHPNTLKRRKLHQKGRKNDILLAAEGSDSIECPDEEGSCEVIQSNHLVSASDVNGIELEIVLPCSNMELANKSGSFPSQDPSGNHNQSPFSAPAQVDGNGISAIGTTNGGLNGNSDGGNVCLHRDEVEARRVMGLQHDLERLKGLKVAIKDWSKDVYGRPEEKKRELVAEILALDYKSESVGLSQEEVVKSKAKFEDLWRLLKSEKEV